MRLSEQVAQSEVRLNRIEAFSDTVFAIVFALLVLELKVPILIDRYNMHELAQRLIEMLPKCISWVIGVVSVVGFWVNYHHVLGPARQADQGLIWLNTLFLGCLSFLPFPIAMMGEYSRNFVAVSAVGLTMAALTLLLVCLYIRIWRRLIAPDAARDQDPFMRRSLIGVLFYFIGITAAWFAVPAAFLIYFSIPLLSLVPGSARKTESTGLQ